MKSFEELDANKDGKLTIEEFLKVAEPPLSKDVPGGPPLEERRARARAEFQNLDTNRDGFVERAEAEALVHAEFNQYDTDRDNKITEPEVRLIVQRALRREAAERQQVEQASAARAWSRINEFIDMQLRERRQARQERRRQGQPAGISRAGRPGRRASRPRACCPSTCASKIAMRKFAEIDTNKDGQLDRVELTGFAVSQFLRHGHQQGPLPDRGGVQEGAGAETKKVRAIVQAMQPAHQPRPAPPGAGAARRAGAVHPPAAGPRARPAPGHALGLRLGTRHASGASSSAASLMTRARRASALLDRHALGEIARLVDVGALGDGRVIGEQLHRDGIEDRRHERIDIAAVVIDATAWPPSRATPAASLIRISLPPRALTCSKFEAVLSNSASLGATTTTGTYSSISAIGPCFISPAA